MYDQVDIDKTSEIFSQMLEQNQGNARPEIVFTPQSTMFIRDKMDYSKSYQPVKEKGSNIDGNFGKDIDLSEHNSKRLRRMPMLERKPKINWEGSCSGSSDYTALTLTLIENIDVQIKHNK